MDELTLKNILRDQQDYFYSGQTLSLAFRKAMLKKLYNVVKNSEHSIADALKSDLGKSEYESYMCEIGLVLSEITYMIKNLKRFASAKRVKTPLAQFKSKSFVLPSPYGNVLIMSPWNYPFLLTISPLCNALAAGNTVVVKPSAYSPATSAIVKKILEEAFEQKYVAVVTGGRAENQFLLKQKFNMVFFTGSQGVGKEVLRNCAEHLTPAILELGGKSPCIVDESAKIELAAKRIVFGKFLNCGQTCVAPDYILCHSSVKDALVKAIISEVKKQFGENPLTNANYGKIINQKHFERLLGLIDATKVVCGGDCNSETLQIEPTVMAGVTFDDAVMQEEIFGPILPILTYDDFNSTISALQLKQKPLALYIFSENKQNIDKALNSVSFGGGCVNDVVIHLATSEMGFGGVGESGMGAYHGEIGFNAFSHKKSIVSKATWMDLPMRYQPYTKKNEKLLRLFLK